MTGHEISDALLAVWAASWIALPPLAHCALPLIARRHNWQPRTFVALAIAGCVLAPLAVVALAALVAYLIVTTPSAPRGGLHD